MRRRSANLVLALGAAVAVSVVVCTAAGATYGQPLHAQSAGTALTADSARTFVDRGAAELLDRARTARLHTDRSLRSYTALVRSRLAGDLRTDLKDRTLVRYEGAARVRWSRDATDIVHVLAGRLQSPAGVQPAFNGPGLLPFRPSADRLHFGLLSDAPDDTARTVGPSRPVRTPAPVRSADFWIEHPLGADAERHYRYQSGDTLVVQLQDGRELRVIELRVIPRRADPHTVRGVLWIDATSGALVQGAFRLARTVDILADTDMLDAGARRIAAVVPFLRPMEFDIALVTVEYALWDMQHWLPRTMRFEGMLRVGGVEFPGALDVGYELIDVETDADPQDASEFVVVARTIAEWRDSGAHRVALRRSGGRRYTRIWPAARARLLDSELLPPPVWTDAPGFASGDEIQAIHDRLASIPLPARPGVPARLRLGWGEPGLLRYNRVEALSVGARVTAPLPYVTALATARIGAGDLHPNAELLLRRETMRRTIELRGYHELATTDQSRRPLGPGNSTGALLFGRDEGEYYRATGAGLTLAPPLLQRRSFELRGYAERQGAVTRNTHVALPRLWQDSVFRPNIVADEATQFGGLLHVRPWWGTDPFRAQFGVDLLLQAEAGDFEHARGSLTLRSAVPLPAKFRIGAEAGVGTSHGAVPVQRNFFLGGASTLRGYEPATVTGTSMARGRLELARTASFGGIAVFSDWGWAGDRTDISRDDRRWSAGVGASLLDGLVRLDLARGLYAPRAWRLDLHLDAVL
jgi:hypothetical protein